MATDGRNIGSEIFKSLSQGLMTYAGERQREQAQERQNALQAFTATLQMQQANRAQLEHAQRMAGLALENRAKDIQLKELLEKQKDPEAYARKQAQAKLAEENQMIAGKFGGSLAPYQANLAGLTGAVQAGKIQLPDNAQMQLGDLTLRGPDPMAQIKADYTKALTNESIARASRMNAPEADAGDGPVDAGTDRADINFKQKKARERALRDANTIYQQMDKEDRKKYGVMTITSEGDLDKVLQKMDKGEGGWFGIGSDANKAAMFQQLTALAQNFVRAGGYGPDGSFPTEEDYLEAKAMGIVE